MARSYVPTITFVSADKNTFKIYGSLALTGTGNYVTGGIPLSFAGLDRLKSRALPLKVEVMTAQPAATPNTAFFTYSFAPGTTMANGTLQIFTGAAAQSGLAELSAGALPAGVTGDVITFEAVFVKNASTNSQS